MKISKVRELLKKLDKKAKKTNKAFEKASPAKKRVMVLEDALKQLRSGKFRAKSGTYFDVTHKKFKLVDDLGLAEKEEVKEDELSLMWDVATEKNQVKSVISLPFTQCNVCAIGGAFASLSRIRDRCSRAQMPGHEIGTWHDNEYMNAVFPEELLRKMESAFEHDRYGYDQKSDRARLVSIYKNIIQNDGKQFTARKESEYTEQRWINETLYPEYLTMRMAKGQAVWTADADE